MVMVMIDDACMMNNDDEWTTSALQERERERDLSTMDIYKIIIIVCVCVMWCVVCVVSVWLCHYLHFIDSEPLWTLNDKEKKTETYF